MSSALPSDPHSLQFLFRALRSRNYRLFFMGQFTSLAGTWISLMAMGWLVYRLTDNAWMLGLVAFSRQVPTFALSPVAGALVDRWDRRRVMVVTQAVDMLTMVVLAVLTLSGTVAVWHLLVGCVVQGLSKAFDMPARQALVVEILDHRDDLPNAIALNSSMFHGARLVGPMLGGVVIWLARENGEGMCFAIDAVSYLAVIGSLLGLRLTVHQPPPVRQHLLRDVMEGFQHTFGFRPIRAMMLLLAALSLLGLPYGTLLPVVARDVLEGGERTYSLLMSAGGLGAFMGAMYLASRSSVLGLGRVITVTTIAFGLSLALLAFSTHLWLSLVLLALAGGTSIVALAGTNTIVQTLVADGLRGRVMSFYGMTFMGMMPVGALLAGKLATLLGAPRTILLGGLASVAGGVIFGLRLPGLRAVARPIYVERGILPAETAPAPAPATAA